ncbi:MAG: hypothetical protein AAF744_06810 [Pseudomonadota bacterium]
MAEIQNRSAGRVLVITGSAVEAQDIAEMAAELGLAAVAETRTAGPAIDITIPFEVAVLGMKSDDPETTELIEKLRNADTKLIWIDAAGKDHARPGDAQIERPFDVVPFAQVLGRG